MNEGLQTALNQIRESIVSDNKVYQEQIPVVSELTSSQAYGQALLSLPSDMRNKFISSLVNKNSLLYIPLPPGIKRFNKIYVAPLIKG